jgi:hypothetical protein
MSFLRTFKWQFLWIGLGLLSLLLRSLQRFAPGWSEQGYARGLYPLLRYLLDYSLGLLPIPLLYLMLLGLAGWGMYRLWKSKQEQTSWKHRLLRGSLNLLALVGGLVFGFMLLWGFNYGRIPIEQQLDFRAQEPSLEQIQQEVEDATARLQAARKQIPGADSLALEASDFPADQEKLLRNALKKVLQQMNYPTPGRVRGRKIYPKGWLIGLGASGIFLGEGNMDAALHPLRQPPVLAHELAHGYGFTDEGVCNFLGVLACEASEAPAFRYAGHLSYWRYLLRDYYRMDSTGYRQLMDSLPQGIRADLLAIRQNQLAYQAWFPRFSERVYNRYLKAQGIREGIASYGRVVNLYLAWKEQKK